MSAKNTSHEQNLLSAAQAVLYNSERLNGVYTGRTSIMAIKNLETVVDIAVASNSNSATNNPTSEEEK